MENNKLPKTKINKEQIISSKNADDLLPVEFTIDKIFLDSANNYIVGISVNDNVYCLVLHPHEGTHLTFVDLGCADISHINTIYQMFVNLMRDTGFKLESMTIESKVGDIFYSRLCWVNNKKDKKIYSLCGLGDGIILARLTKSQMYIIKNILPLIDAYDEWEFSDEHYED